MQTSYVRLLLGLAAMLLCLPAFSLTLYVSPDGDDAWSGKLQTANRQKTDGPVASLTGARDAVRRLKAQGPLTEPVTVKISPGAYAMAEPLVLEPQDSGTEQAPITYQGVPYRSIFPGGRKITGFKPGPGGVWQATVPQVAAGDYYFEQLWINGRRMIRARTPNAESPDETPQPRYLYVWKKRPFGVDPATDEEIWGAMLSGPENMPKFGDGQLTPEEKAAITSFIQNNKATIDPGGLPLGVQIVAPFGRDRACLEAGRFLERQLSAT